MANKWSELRTSALSLDSVSSKMERYAIFFEQCGAWNREYNRWTGNDGCPVVKSLSEEVKLIEQWYGERISQMDDYLRPYSDGVVSPSQNKATNKDGRVYSIDGKLVGDDISALKALPAGVYIVDKQKIVK